MLIREFAGKLSQIPGYISVRCSRAVTCRLAFMMLLAATTGAAVTPHEASAQATRCSESVILQPGQTLATLAASNFGTQDAVAELIAATNALAAVDSSYTTIQDPNAVEAGWKICVPVPSSDNSGEATVSPSRTSRWNASTVGIYQAPRQLTLSAAALEQNHALLESTLAARMGETGVHPLSIEYLRRQRYPGSPLTIEATLPGGSDYRQYLVTYRSEGLKLYAAMTVPVGEKPGTGWPVVIFNHGYIEPALYSPTTSYTDYVDAIASSGYIVLRPDLRGHGKSQGVALGAYGDPGYVIDVLNALASVQQYADADPNRIGMWGHSMGGYITARAMVVSDAIRAGVVWSGVVAPYEQLAGAWDPQSSTIAEGEPPVPAVLAAHYGTPEENPDFWQTLSANTYAVHSSGPVQLHHGTADTSVPVAFSDAYYADLIAAGQAAEYYLYADDDHNISVNFADAMRRSLAFLDTHVKQNAASLAEVPTSNTAPATR